MSNPEIERTDIKLECPYECVSVIFTVRDELFENFGAWQRRNPPECPACHELLEEVESE